MLAILVLGVQVAVAQKIAYIETALILEKMPAYEEAGQLIDAQMDTWEAELDGKFQAIESMYQEYVNNEPTLDNEMKRQKQEAIFKAESEANTFKEEKFGMDGDLSKLQEEKFGPLYDQVYAAAEKVATENGYDYVFDLSADNSWIYTNQAHNLTEKVIAELKL
jgi:Skp family chaperone for outer membrane proteins